MQTISSSMSIKNIDKMVNSSEMTKEKSKYIFLDFLLEKDSQSNQIWLGVIGGFSCNSRPPIQSTPMPPDLQQHSQLWSMVQIQQHCKMFQSCN